MNQNGLTSQQKLHRRLRSLSLTLPKSLVKTTFRFIYHVLPKEMALSGNDYASARKRMERMEGMEGRKGWKGGRDGKRINNRIRITRRMIYATKPFFNFFDNNVKIRIYASPLLNLKRSVAMN